MSNRHLKLSILACLTIALGLSSVAVACILPQDLSELAKNRGFSQVDGFFDRPGMIEAPFVYGYLPGEKEDSSAFWVRSKREGEFLLVVEANVDIPAEYSCPDTIPWRNFPGGLSIIRNERMSLDEFVYVSEPGKKGPVGKTTTHNAIMSYYDGVEVIFYCHEGHWLALQRH